MAELMLGASSFIQELLYISSDIVWKDEGTAQLYENNSNATDVALYMSAKKNELNFTTIPAFSREVLIKAGVPINIIESCVIDKNQIPVAYRANAIRYQTDECIQKYEEKNNYYRQLYGLPDLDDADVFYNTKYPELSSSTIPVHQLPLAVIYNLEAIGYFDELYAENPTKKYLRHLGKRKIEPYTARNAERFSILYMNSSDFNRINVDFRDTYNVCRYALLRSIYSSERRKDNPYYDGFMAMMVLFMSVQQMMAKYLDADINRDFYDYESLKYVYDTYGVPFFPSIPLEYHIKIIKNINILIRYKGSTQVFYELFNIFNFGSMEVFDFYIMKTHRFENGKPIFRYKADGSEDLRAMYELKFGQVQLYNNPPLELSNPENILNYDTMTAIDPYWVSDEALLEKLYNTEFNYIESKYIGIRTVFDLMAITYESALFFKMMLDNRSVVSNMDVFFNPLYITVDFFSIIIYACALICKRLGYDGILNGPNSYIAKILGFNFKADLDIVREDILNNPETCDDAELLNLIIGMNVSSLATVNVVFEKIRSLRKLFIQRKFYAKTRAQFQAYSELEKVLMLSSYMKDLIPEAPEYDPSNPNTAYTFGDLLSSLNAELYQRYAEMHYSDADTEMIDMEIETVLVLIRQNVSNLKYVEMYASSSSNVMIEHLFKLLEFFKSAKAELTGFTISYNLGKRDEAALKLFFEDLRYYCTYHEVDYINYLKASIHALLHKILIKNGITFKDHCEFDGEILHLESDLSLIMRIKLICKTIAHFSSVSHLHDILYKMEASYRIDDKLELTGQLDLLYEKIIHEVITHIVNDMFESLSDKIIKCTEVNMHNNVSEMHFDAKDLSETSSYKLSDSHLFDTDFTIKTKQVRKESSSVEMKDQLILIYEQIIPEQNSDE